MPAAGVDLCRDRVSWIGFTTTYNNAGTAELRASRTRYCNFWVGETALGMTLRAALQSPP